jgi:hypothetical protein
MKRSPTQQSPPGCSNRPEISVQRWHVSGELKDA